MKIGIIGDTHGSQQAIRKAVQLMPPVELLLHTGDYAPDANVLETLTGLPVIKVTGNCDRDGLANPDEIFEREGFNIWLTHGHKYFHYGEVGELAWWANRLEANIVVYGHTHMPMAKWYGDVLLINPGSPARPRGGSKPSFAVLTLNEGEKPQVELIELPVEEPKVFSAFEKQAILCCIGSYFVEKF